MTEINALDAALKVQSGEWSRTRYDRYLAAKYGHVVESADADEFDEDDYDDDGEDDSTEEDDFEDEPEESLGSRLLPKDPEKRAEMLKREGEYWDRIIAERKEKTMADQSLPEDLGKASDANLLAAARRELDPGAGKLSFADINRLGGPDNPVVAEAMRRGLTTLEPPPNPYRPPTNDAEAQANYQDFLQHKDEVLAAQKKIEQENLQRREDPDYDRRQASERFQAYKGKTYTAEEVRQIGVEDQAVALQIIAAGLMQD